VVDKGRGKGNLFVKHTSVLCMFIHPTRNCCYLYMLYILNIM
jgi:hypothetical protein